MLWLRLCSWWIALVECGEFGRRTMFLVGGVCVCREDEREIWCVCWECERECDCGWGWGWNWGWC